MESHIKKSWQEYKTAEQGKPARSFFFRITCILINKACLTGKGSKRRKINKSKYESIERFTSSSSIFDVEISHNDKFTIVNKKLKLAAGFDLKGASFLKITKKISQFIQDMFTEMTHGMDSDDQIFCALFHPSLDMPIGISFMTLEDFTPQMLENQISRVCQSKKTLRIDNQLEIKCKIARVVSGSGLGNDKLLSDLFATKRCIKRIKSDDNFCAVRALLVAKVYCDKNIQRMDNFRRLNNSKLEEEVSAIVKKLGLIDQPQDLSDVAKIENHMKHYQVTIYDHNTRFADSKHPIYRGPRANQFLYLLYYKKHYWPIISPQAFFEKRAFCHWCKTATDHMEFHNCNYVCTMCKRAECKQETADYRECVNCGFNCYNETCTQIHSTKYCRPRSTCEYCGAKFIFKHKCQVVEKKWCVSCKIEVDLEHRCFMKTGKLKNADSIFGYIFFDFESSQEFGTHVPNLVIAHKYDRHANLLEKRYFYNGGENVNEMFCNWLFNQKNYIAMAHNLKGYDGIFVMNYLLNHLKPGTQPPSVLNQGNKILTLQYNDVKLVDSYLFMPMALAEFSNTFGFADNKGHFPHLFNTKQNQDYVGCLPPIDAFGIGNMNEEKKTALVAWYKENENVEFNFKGELFKYCEMDVELLAKGCFAFRRIILESTRIEPFIQCTTLASLCHTIYRHNYMPYNSIAIIPEIGYNPKENTSKKARIWLRYLASTHNLSIQHANNGGEFSISPYKLDGYCNGVGYEFHGCVYHGCPKCFSPRTYNQVKQESMQVTQQRHRERIEFIKQKVSRLEEIWECEWDELVKTDAKVRAFVLEQDLRDGLSPRDALFGGRTNAAKLYHLASEAERIEYIDVCSLYPYVMIANEYPIGHPRIITENFDDLRNYFGLVSCRVLPPRKLYFPVLPLKMHNKLLFPLCHTCAYELNTEYCAHNDHDRCIEGAWCTPEMHTALEYGYKVVKIFEVWHWPQRSKDLFCSYIKNFLKIKQESSGYPNWAQSEEQRAKYIDDYFEGERVRLDPMKIRKNNGLRKIAKLLLNTLWGRFGMNLNKSRVIFVTDREEWYKLLADENCIIHDVQDANPDVLMVVCSERDDMHLGGNQTNVPLASFVTTYARLKLFSALVKLDKRVLYYDTDSIIFVSDNDFRSRSEYPKLGDFLGDWTDETGDRKILEFLSCGAKKYALFFSDGTTECVVSGIQLTSVACEKLNFESMKQVLLSEQKSHVMVPQSRIRISRKGWILSTVDMEKEFNMVYDKRVLCEHFNTRPYGY